MTDPLRGEKILAKSYVVALLFIGALAVATHSLADFMIASNDRAAHVVEAAAGQRMLSQRINLLALEMVHEADDAQQDHLRRMLNKAISDMSRVHLALLRGDDSMNIPQITSPALDAIYFDLPQWLDMKVRTYIGAARNLADLPPESVRNDRVLLSLLVGETRDDLLETLDLAVQQYVVESQKTISRLRLALWGLLAALLITLVLEGLFIFRPVFRRLLSRTRELYDMARTDPLTGCYNRRSFIAFGDGEYEIVRGHRRDCCILMLDIDHFKSVNDTYGHQAGDLVIKAVAQTCLDGLRRSDVLGRLGGEEFAIILPETAPDQAVQVAEKLRQAIHGHVVSLPDGQELTVSVSVGVSRIEAADDGVHAALERADNSLYDAKRGGRNRVCTSVLVDA